MGRAESTDGGLQRHGETVGGKYDATLWLVGAETSLYAAWLGVYSWQLLRDTVGPVGSRVAKWYTRKCGFQQKYEEIGPLNNGE